MNPRRATEAVFIAFAEKWLVRVHNDVVMLRRVASLVQCIWKHYIVHLEASHSSSNSSLRR
jgi:hypothetical protein